MNILRIASAALFVACSLLIMTFSLELILITSEISIFEGETELRGKVIDQAGDPVSNVSVRSGESTDLTDVSGLFRLERIQQGKNVIELYKDGFVGVRAGMVLYPDEKRWIGDSDEGPNDFSKDPFILYDEIDWQDVDEADKISIVVGSSIGAEQNTTLIINVFGYLPEDSFNITIYEKDSIIIKRSFYGGNRQYMMNYVLSPGEYNVTLTGKDILDRGMTRLQIERGRTYLNITAEEQSFLEYGLDQDIRGNYFLGGAYIAIGLACAMGAYLSLRTDRWNILIIISVLTFLGRGPLDIYGMNIMPFFSLSTLLLSISLRGDMVRRRDRLRTRPFEKT